MTTGSCCGDERRRVIARAKGVNGIDGIRVAEDQRHLSVLLFGKAPPELGPRNIRIDPIPADAQARRVTVLSVQPCPDPDPQDSECLQIVVDTPGDWSRYTLTVDAPGFDQRLNRMEFTFKEHCRTSLDCDCGCGGEGAVTRPVPVIDYLSRDYSSLRRQLLDRLSLLLPDWTERHEADVGITLVDLLAYAGDLLNYRLDAVGTEAYLDTARLRTSLRRHARLVDHRMHDGAAARAFVCLDADQDVVLPAGTFRFRAGDTVFEPLVREDVRIVGAHRRIDLWTWGGAECPLPAGATEAVLVDDGLDLDVGDLLLFEELSTGLAADADREHRQVVRLLDVQPDHDDLLDQALLRVRWDSADALTFTLHGGVARGNVIVVGHGASLTWCQAPPEPMGSRASLAKPGITQLVPWPDPATVAGAQAAALGRLPDRVRSRLDQVGSPPTSDDTAWLTTVFGAAAVARYDAAGLTGRFDRLLAAKLDRLERLRCRARAGDMLDQATEGVELEWSWGYPNIIDPSSPALRGPAATVASNDPADALPTIRVSADDGTCWTPRHDLLAAGPDDTALVGEVDDDGYCRLRFGDGRQGLPPEAGARLVADYRVGNGRSGNVGAEAIDTIETCGLDVGPVRVRNPMPASGGADPETAAEVRRWAPRDAYDVLARAVTADDYARIAGDLPRVQRAAAALRWTGAWYEATVGIDALGAEDPSPDLLMAERDRLHRFRRIGHDVVVRPAELVSLSLGLCVRVDPAYVNDEVRRSVTACLDAFFAPDRFTFGTPVRTSSILAAVAAVPGVAGAVVTRLARQFGPDDGGRALAEGQLELGPLEVARLDNDAARPDHGILTQLIGGGR